MKRLVSALAAVCLLLGAVPATYAADPDRQHQRAELKELDPTFVPMLADAERKVTVVLELAASPASAVAGAAAERLERAKALRSAQGRLDRRIAAAGGRILDRYQYAYNGIKVRVNAAELLRLAAMPGVVGVRRLATYTPDNTNAIPYIGAPRAWQASDVTGRGQTIAIIDTGVDYTHANFGGPGTVAAHDDNDPTVIEPDSFPTRKVIAGYDFAGDDYDADEDDGSEVPDPDPDPLDCNGHGSHVAGTAAGQGVLADHETYTGPYGPSIFEDPDTFLVGPGVAPRAKLVALKVFGCEGSTDLVVDALEWVAAYNVSHVDGIDVVNMSLGSPFGDPDSPDVIATNNLVSMGVVVVTSAGNEGNVPFITGAPGTATRAISVAALDAFPSIPLATVDLPDGPDIDGNNQNAYPDLPVSGVLHVVPDGAGGVSLGCTADDYDAASDGKIVAVKRGVCPFVDKGAAAQEAGAIGIIVINRDDTAPGDLPTFIGWTPELFRIPMVGVDKTAQPVLLANEGASITLRPNGFEPNPTYQQIVGFSSSGPRYGDNFLKPDVAAPGVNLFSTLTGSGWNGTTKSGTSMAAPGTAGTAALILQAHPGWSPLRVKAAIVNTADASASAILDYDPLRSGSGVVQADRAVSTVAVATTSQGTASLSFGYEPSNGAYSESARIRISNTSSDPITYTLEASSPLVTISPATVTVAGRDSSTVRVTAHLSRSQVADLPSADQFITEAFGELYSLSGAITATPTTSGPGIHSLRVAYLLVPRGLSDVETTFVRHPTPGSPTLRATLRLRNDGVHDGYGDVYALGRIDPRGDGDHGTDVRAIGVQSGPADMLTGEPDPDDRALQFVINTWDRFATPSTNEIDVAVDTDGDKDPNYFVIGIDNGLVSAGAHDGLFISVILDAETEDIVGAWLADAPLNGSTIILPALASELGLTADASSFRYWVVAFDGFTGLGDQTSRSREFDVFDPAQSTGAFVEVPAGETVRVPVRARKAAVASGDVRGWLVVTLDDANGSAQADVIRP